MTPNRRKIRLINPPFQLRFLLWTSLAAVLVFLTFFVSHKYFFSSFVRQGVDAGLPPDHVFFRFLEKQEQTLDMIFLTVAVGGSLIITYFSLRVSHRIAGPLYRLNKHMDAVAAGQTTSDVAFRTGDFFPELAESYNRQLKRLLGQPPRP